MRNNWRKISWLLAVTALVGILAACGGAPGPGGAGTPPPTNPGDGPSNNHEQVVGIRFDFSNAVGLQIDNDARVSTLSGGSSNLFKVTRTGGLELALIQGSVYVQDFFIRNGKIYAVFENDHYSNSGHSQCVLAEINSAGEVFCVDSELSYVDLQSIQFDAEGGIYYRGYTNDGYDVIRRAKYGEVTDFYNVRTGTRILDFVVTRYGDLVVNSDKSGLGWEYFLEVINEDGVVRRLLLDDHYPHDFFEILPDGSLLVFDWDRGFMSVLLGTVPNIDQLPYLGVWEDSDQNSSPAPRLKLSYSEDEYYHAISNSIDYGLKHKTSERFVVVHESGVYEVFPDVQKIELPMRTYRTAEIRGNHIVIGGTNESLNEVLVLLSLETDEYTDILKGHNIEVVSVYFDGDTVFFFGRNLNNNRPALGEYDIRLDIVEVSDIARDVGEGFQILDWSVSHVAPDPYWRPEPVISVELQEGLGSGQFEFSAEETKWVAFMDEIRWDFGDGFTADSESVMHQYQFPGTYTVVLEMTTRMGVSESVSTTVEVSEGQVVFVEDFVQTGNNNSFLLLSTGEVFVWGGATLVSETDDDWNEYSTYKSHQATFPNGAGAITRLAASDTGVFALDEFGKTYKWVLDRSHPIPVESFPFEHFPIGSGEDVIVKQISVSRNAGIAVTDDGELFQWGLVGSGDSAQKLVEFSDKSIRNATLGFGRIFAIDEQGEVWAAGDGSEGRLGIGETNYVAFTNPALVSTLSGLDIREIVVGYEATFAITDQGDLYSWGQNYDGQRGDESGVDRLTPTLMATLPGSVKSLGVNTTLYPSFTVALLESGELFAWGYSSWEIPLLADGDSSGRIIWIPSSVDTLSHTTKLFVGDSQISVIDERGSLLGWGDVLRPDVKYHPTRALKPVVIR